MRRLAPALAAVVLCLALPARGGHVNVATVDGSINPAVGDYLMKAIEQSEQDGAEALLLLLDTPGGLVSTTKDIIQAMLNAKVPVIVYVSPHGAWAGSAGTFITLAGHVAAMAPGTTIGAAHPVSIGGGGGGGDDDEEGKRDYAAEKAEKFMTAFIESIAKRRDRNVEWAVKAVRDSEAISQDEALELGVIDLVSDSQAELFEAIQGREVEVVGETRVLDVVGAQLVELEMSAIGRFLNVLASPDIATLLILAGLLGLYVEFTQPGAIVPGAVGLVCLVLGFVSLQIIPFSWLGLFFMIAGMGLFLLEIFVASYGLLFAAGVACLLFGGSMLFDMPEVSDLNVSFWSVLVPAVGTLAAFAAIVVYAVARGMLRPQVAGTYELIGLVGRADSALDPDGSVFVRGEYWNASAEGNVAAGEAVEVTGVEGMRLRVRRAGSQD